MSLEKKARETFRATENVTKSIEQRVNLIESPQILEQFVVSYMRDFAAPYEAALRECQDALTEAINTIKVFHGPVAWEVYERNAPKRLKQALASASDLLEGGNDDQD